MSGDLKAQQSDTEAKEQVLYFVETPFQLFSALCVYFTRGEHERSNARYLQCMITDKFDKAGDYAQIINELGLFDEVTLVQPFPYDQKNFGTKYFVDYLFNRDKMKEFFFERYPTLRDVSYDEIVTSAIHRFISYVKSCNGQHAKTILFEDGIGTFDGEMYAEITILDRLIRLTRQDPLGFKMKNALKPLLNMVTGGKLAFHPEALYLFEAPARVRERYQNVPLLKNLLPSSGNMDVFESVFPVKAGDVYKDSQYIYLATTDLDKIGAEKEERLFDVINSTLSDTLLLRSHPREEKRFKTDKKYDIDQSGDLWEMLCAKGYIDEQTTLFSVCSTAQLNPKLIFDKEPYLVFLYELFPDDVNFDKAILRKTSDEARRLYSNPARVFTPRTSMELVNIIESL